MSRQSMQARIFTPTSTNLRRLAMRLQRGELVGIPTETVYGLAADALNADACHRIFAAKGRPANDPLIVHVLDLAHAEELAEFNEPARRIAARFWPGPLTLVLPKKSCVPDIVTSGRNTVAIRAPAHPLTRRLLRLAGIPLAAPSANPFGYISPTTPEHVSHGLGKKISAILDGGPCSVGVESTILDLTNPLRPRILRPGSITAASLVNTLGSPLAKTSARATSNQRGLIAPGMLTQHYSPRTRLVIKSGWDKLPPKTAGILLRQPAGKTKPGIFWLSTHASLAEIARNLYHVLRLADQGGYREIWFEQLPNDESGLAAAINDRVRRAAAAKH